MKCRPFPSIGIPRVNGLEIKAMCEQGPVHVKLATDVENGWLDVKLTIGALKAVSYTHLTLPPICSV